MAPASSPSSYGGLINPDSPGVYSVASSEYGAAQHPLNDSNFPSPELGGSAMPSPLDVNRSVLNVKRGTPMLHSASTSSLGNLETRSQVAEPGFHTQSILAGLENMLAQSGREMFELNDPLITHIRFMLKPYHPEPKAPGRFAQMKAKLAPKRTPDVSAPLNLRSAYQGGRSDYYHSMIGVIDPTIEAVRKLFPEELTNNLKALVAIVISIRYLDKLPVPDPNSPLTRPGLQLSPDPAPVREIVGFENAPAKARAMLGMGKGIKVPTVQRSSSEVVGEPANDVQPEARDRLETLRLRLKALGKHMIKDAADDMSEGGVQKLFDAVTEIVRLSEGFE